MRKKITMLLASLFACVGVMKAGVTDLPVLTTDAENPVLYAIKNTRSGKYANYAGDGVKMTQVSTLEATSLFYFTADGEAADGYTPVKIHAVGTDKLMNDFASWTEAGHTWFLSVESQTANATGLFITRTANLEGWNAFNDGASTSITNYLAKDAGSIFILEAVAESALADAFDATKTAVAGELDGLVNLPALYTQAATIKTRVEALAATTLAEVLANTKVVLSDLATAKAEANGKSVVFDNNASGERNGLSVTATGGKAYGTASEGDETIWTIKMQDNGSFKLYNFVTDKYLNEPGNMNLVDESGAAAYNFIVTDVNKVALVVGSKMLHQANYWSPNYDLIDYYKLNDAASIWTLTEKGIKISREQYDLAAAAKATLPYAIQEAYGLVKDASKYTSNAMQTNPAEGSYANLLDNKYSSYFHTSWSAVIGADHYLQAEVSEEVKDFCFYFKKRDGNNNNRPTEIEVLGSSNGTDFTPITTITTGLPTDASQIDYFSAKISADKNVKYIRFVVKKTNTGALDNQHSTEDPKPEGHPFFTFSEFYVLPATTDVISLINSYNAFATSSITSEDMASAATALINAETTLALANIKKEAAALLSANESNHAATPELGQYTTGAYNALNAAYVAADATQESLEAAIAAFEKSLNVPVYFITSKHNGYAAGSAIYYDGAWKWKKANIYDRQMWMTIPGYTEENVPAVDAYDANGTSYAIYDYLTGTKMRGKDVQIVKVAGWEGAYNLQYNADANSTDAAQHAKDNGQLVNWKPGTTDDAQASVWGVEYIGGTYDLDKLTDEHIAALGSLKSAYDAKAFYADAVLGEGLGQYKGTEDAKAAIVATLAPAEAILNGTLTEQANATVEDINAAATVINEVAGLEINLPEAGKYYRFQGACEAVKSNYYITGHTNADGGRIACTEEADASTIFYYADDKLVAYQSGLYIGLNANYWTFASIADDSNSASEITFAASPRTAGAYTIKSADRYLHYFYYTGDQQVQVNRCQDDIDAEHDWYITEVTTLPVEITTAGYATFYAPVEVTLPEEGITAHTVTENGNYATLSEAISVVPAENGVILAGAKGTYNLTISNTGAADLENALAGTVAKTLVTKAEGDAYYVLAKKDEKVGLYNPVNAEDNTTFYNASHKAYWHIAAAAQGAGYVLGRGGDDESTGIDQLINNGEVVIYDLAGRRVEKMEKGIYIVNGKKVVK